MSSYLYKYRYHCLLPAAGFHDLVVAADNDAKQPQTFHGGFPLKALPPTSSSPTHGGKISHWGRPFSPVQDFSGIVCSSAMCHRLCSICGWKAVHGSVSQPHDPHLLQRLYKQSNPPVATQSSPFSSTMFPLTCRCCLVCHDLVLVQLCAALSNRLSQHCLPRAVTNQSQKQATSLISSRLPALTNM